MELTAKNIKNIEGILSTGMMVEVFISPEHKADSGGGVMVDVPETLIIRAMPPIESEIRFAPILLDDERNCPIEIRAQQPGEDPVALIKLMIPKGKYLAGLITVEKRFLNIP